MAAFEDDAEQRAVLTIEGAMVLPVENENGLREALEGLPLLSSGQEAKLARGPRHYIRAVRHGDLWSVTTRNGSYLTLVSFTGAMTTDYSEREAKESRATGSIWKRIRRRLLSPPPERSLSAAQVQTLFGEFFLGKGFSIPQSGA